MGDISTPAKARLELEELYLGVPDDSVNLTFQHLAQVQQQLEKPKPPIIVMEPIQEAKTPKHASSSHTFIQPPTRHHNDQYYHRNQVPRDRDPHSHSHNNNHNHNQHSRQHTNHHNHHGGYDIRHHRNQVVETSMMYDDVSGVSMASTYRADRERVTATHRRPGIPHSNICTICTTYIYIFRHRCLVCGRVYCRNCVAMGMGEMTEGRKCIQCLGRRFSQRYIQKAGDVGCCFGYPSTVKQAELKWAEKGPRRSGERAYARSMMMSRSRNPMGPMIQPMAHNGIGTSFSINHNNNPPSFVTPSSPSPYSPFSTPTRHHLPL